MIRTVSFAGCLGWLHEVPAGHPRTDCSVVICAPHGYEELCTHRALRDGASLLAQAGFATLRFDYLGTGDSLESDEDAGRLPAWLGSIEAAVAFVRAATGVRSVALVGLRIGGLLAATVAARLGDVEAVALMAPTSSGRLYLREQLAVSRLTADSPADAADGAMNVAGFTYTQETCEALQHLDLLKLPHAPARRVLLLAREDQREANSRLQRRLEELGAQVGVARFDGYEALMQDARLAETPVAAFGGIAEWLDRSTVGVWDDRPADAELHDAAISHPDFTEQVVELHGTTGLSAVLCAPTRPNPKTVTTVFLNTSANRRIGYGRVWVAIARELARRGFPSLRLDIGGVGDSDGRTPPGRVVYAEESSLDARAALDHLQARGHHRFVLLGLCSGAHLAYHTALADPRVSMQVLVNLQYFHWQEGDRLDVPSRRSTGFYLRRARQGTTWMRLLRGEVAVDTVLRSMADRYRARLTAQLSRLIHRSDGKRARVRSEMAQLAQRGVRTCVVYGSEDPGIDEFTHHFGRTGRRFRRMPGSELVILDDADHNLALPTARRQFTMWLMDALERHAATAPGTVHAHVARSRFVPWWSPTTTLRPHLVARSARNA
jgi:pimeloyl-ACP methyl ester carboxylesterase